MELVKMPVQAPPPPIDFDRAMREELPAIVRAWVKPVRPQFEAMVMAWNTPAAELTTRDLWAIGIFGGYCTLTALVLARVAQRIILP